MSALNRNLLWLLGAAFFLVVVWYFSDIVAYILIAWVFSMLGRPLMNFFQKRIHIGRFHMGPIGATILTILTFYLVLTGVLLILVPTIVAQAGNLAGADYEALGIKLKGLFSNLDTQLHQIGLLQQFYAIYRFDDVGDLFDDRHIASLGEVGNAFDELFHYPWRCVDLKMVRSGKGKNKHILWYKAGG